MTRDMARRVESLSTDATEVTALGQEIDGRAAAGEFAWIGDLGAEIASRAAGVKDSQWYYDVVFDRVQRALAAHPGRESLRTLVRLPLSLRQEDPQRTSAERRLAALVAGGHRADDVDPVVFGEESGRYPLSHEFKACLLHELVLKGAPVEEHAGLSSFAGALVAEGHPLAVLPLTLLPAERGLRRPPHAADWTWALPPSPMVTFEGPELHASPQMRQRTAHVDMTEITDAASAEAMGAAVRHWCAQSNGKVAAQEFWSPDPVAPDDFPAVFERLPLIPWRAEDAPARLYASASDTVLRVLLTAAALSPAYGSGLYGAYGRLAAWRSLGALVGAPADAPLTDTAERVERAHWFRAAPASDWFHEVAWDFAVVALRPGGQEIAVLAATDTD
ncbi:DUF6183 family protein [Streptomyces ficellus]|uniref:DUF6183 family protein n=1 Tax=Streptomyces ficellus TaxID=1977088 RepID=A0ABT7Z5D0_9ACTN|nr:DUF6183 family protein [Streptomyces ficellus]MDN3294296.1 DUF6183 family protein [Streptomyces ficellus]